MSTTPFRQGWDARHAEQTECTYPPLSTEWCEWHEGFTRADKHLNALPFDKDPELDRE